MSYNFHCYVFNPANIFLIKITLQNIDIVSKNYILVTDCRKIKEVHFLDVWSILFVETISLTPSLIFHPSLVLRSLVIHADMIG